MREDYIKEKILEVYKECDIRTFPIDCMMLLQHYGFIVRTYEAVKCMDQELYQTIRSYSDDAIKFLNYIYYNERHSDCRIRFSLMHELGHYILNHLGESVENEAEADYFASNILAPRIIIHKYKYQTADDIHHHFGLSYAASNIALSNYKSWLFNISQKKEPKPSLPELQLVSLFY